MEKDLREEHAIILDFLPNGYPFDKRPIHKKTAIAQAIGTSHFSLLELVPKKGSSCSRLIKYTWARESATIYTTSAAG